MIPVVYDIRYILPDSLISGDVQGYDTLERTISLKVLCTVKYRTDFIDAVHCCFELCKYFFHPESY